MPPRYFQFRPLSRTAKVCIALILLGCGEEFSDSTPAPWDQTTDNENRTHPVDRASKPSELADHAFAPNETIHLSTDIDTQSVKGLIQLQFLTEEAKALIAYQDQSGQDVIWLQAHDYLKHPDNRHRHFSIEASDARGRKQTRLGVGYGADVVDVTVNQANLVINRNTGMTNGNILLSGGGGGGVFKHSNSFAFYPNQATNASRALQVGLNDGGDIVLRTLGTDRLRIGKDMIADGRIGMSGTPTAGLQLRKGTAEAGGAPLKFMPGRLTSKPEDGTIEYDGARFYATTQGVRRPFDCGGLRRIGVNDRNYAVQPDDSLIAFAHLTTERFVTLPAPDSMPNAVITLKDESGEAGRFGILIDGIVDGSADQALRTPFGSLTLYSTGEAWFTK